MKVKNITIAIFALTILIILWLFIDERKRSKKLESIIQKLNREKDELQTGYLDLLMKYLESLNSVEPSVIQELKKLKNQIDLLDEATHIELNSVIKQVNNNDVVKAVRDLAKIVENKLKEKAGQHVRFSKKPMLHDLLEFAKECGWINDQMYSNGMFLKEIRNKESHELAVEFPPHQLGMAMFSGIEILYSVCRPPQTTSN